MSQHLAHRLYGYSLFKRDERGKGVSCGMRGKGKGYACTQPEGFQATLIVLVLDERKQRFPFIAVKPFYQPYGFGQ